MGNYAVMVENKQTPSKLFETCKEAQDEAIRLTIKERMTSYVLMVVSVVELQAPVVRNLFSVEDTERDNLEKHCYTCEFDSIVGYAKSVNCIGCGAKYRNWQPRNEEK